MIKQITILFIIILLAEVSMGQKATTENVVLITLDGFRWQEVFRGADTALMKQQPFLKDGKLREKYWRADAGERRKVLFPFLWSTIVSQGQLIGNRDKNSRMNVTNRMWFSYPGYNELLTGKADDERITSNDKKYNPNVTVLEFLNSQPALKGKVTAYTSWDCFPYIINDKRSGIPVNAALAGAKGNALTEREKALNDLLFSTPNPLEGVRLDAFTFYYGLEYMKKHKPRVMYFSFDETDDFAHGGEYAAYLNAAHYTDGFIKELWDYLQTDPTYKNKTTLLITVDHGRGVNAEDWKDHGIKVNQANQIWMAASGSGVLPLGEEVKEGQLYQNQIAKTIAQLLGYAYNLEGIGAALQLNKPPNGDK